MANAKRVAPPIFSNDVTYKFWKNRIEVSTVICGVPQNEQGILLLLQKLFQLLTTAELHKETGLKILIRKLDDAFQDEEVENAYSTSKKFINSKNLQKCQ